MRPRQNAPARHERVAEAGDARLVRTDFDALPGWAADDHAAALVALRRTAIHVNRNGPHRTASLLEACALTGADFVPAFRDALATPDHNARAFFERWFDPFQVEGSALGGADGRGLVTGFYEPTIAAAPTQSDDYPFPIHAPPPDLCKAGALPHAPDLPRDHAWGIARDGQLHEAPDRAAVEEGALARQAPYRDWPVIAWAADRIDLYFAHIQGAARLAMPDGSVRRITYAAKSGHPFTPIGALLRERGELASDDVSMATIRRWLRKHPDRADALMRENRSYIFFKEAPVSDPSLGPVAAARVPLQPGRSLAVDRRLHSFGTPIFVSAPALEWDDAPFERLMIAQETGSAIIGAARGDIFTGSGAEAGERAGSIATPAQFVALLPRAQRA